MQFPRVSNDKQLSRTQTTGGIQQSRSQIGNYIEAFTDYLLAYNDSIKLLINGQQPPTKQSPLLRHSASYHPTQPAQNTATTSIEQHVVMEKDNLSKGDEQKQVKKNGNRYTKVKGPKQALHSLGKGSSKYRGVSWHKDNQRWRATIFKGNKPVHIGYFEKEVDAAHAYDREALKVRASNAILNFPAIEYPDVLVDLHRCGRMLLDEATQKQCNNLLQASKEQECTVRNDEGRMPKLQVSSSNDTNLSLLPLSYNQLLLSLPNVPFQPPSSYFAQVFEARALEQNSGNWMRKKMRRSYPLGNTVE